MKNTPNIIVNTPKKEFNPLNLLVGGIVLVGAGYGGYLIYQDHRSKKAAGELDTPEKQAASKIYNAKNWYGDDEDIVFEVAKEIAEKKLSWKEVSKSFTELYKGNNIDDYLNFLDAEEKARFFQIINLSAPAEPGKPPVQSTLNYDVIKNVCIAYANKGTNIRKTPEIKDNGGIFPGATLHSNIVATAPVNTLLGMLTGNYKLSSDGKAGFVELSLPVKFGPGKISNRNVWVAGSNITIKQFSRKIPGEKEKGYALLPKALLLNGNTYNYAAS